jgi:hypothetical protein
MYFIFFEGDDGIYFMQNIKNNKETNESKILHGSKDLSKKDIAQ